MCVKIIFVLIVNSPQRGCSMITCPPCAHLRCRERNQSPVFTQIMLGIFFDPPDQLITRVIHPYLGPVIDCFILNCRLLRFLPLYQMELRNKWILLHVTSRDYVSPNERE